MKFYQHHIGDFDKKTRHLSRLERSIYRDMMDIYYDSELPLPADRKALCRKLMANDRKEVAAVEQVLSEFFTLEDDGWHNQRCDQEIAAYNQRASKARANGQTGGRPRKNPGETNPVSDGIENETNAKANHEPITNNQDRGEVVARARDPDLDLERKLREAAGWQNDPGPKLAITGEISAMIDNGADLDLDVLPVVKALAPKADGRSWAFFVKAIARQRDSRIAAETIVTEPTTGGQNRHGTAQQKPSRSDTFAAINARIAQLAEAERAATGDGFPDDGNAA